LAKQYPDQYGRSPLYRNPERTLPFPEAADVPVPQWYSAKVAFDWDSLVTAQDGKIGILYTYIWTSPVFDLRPDLRSANNGTKQGTPIWSRSARLYVQLTEARGGTFPFPSPLVAAARDFAQDYKAAPEAPGSGAFFKGSSSNVQQINEFDATAAFATSSVGGQESVMAGFAPPGNSLGFGEGYPIRWWRVSITFTVFCETGLPLPNPVPPQPECNPVGFSLPVLTAAMY
jgi:hypothetical protein